MGADDLTKFLKAVKASNQNIGDAGDVIAGYQARVKGLADERGISDGDFDWMWESFTGFAAYGFNRAHSTAYGITAYRCAYLLTHHPVEFHAALLAVAAGTPKEAGYVKATRARGHRIVAPDVNASGVTYSVDGNKVVKGLLSVKGIGEKTAREIINCRPPGGYSSISELATTVDHRKVTGILGYLSDGDLSGSLGKLEEAGVFRNLEQ
jgi:DNA polymerase-3 subunit alpha